MYYKGKQFHNNIKSINIYVKYSQIQPHLYFQEEFTINGQCNAKKLKILNACEYIYTYIYIYIYQFSSVAQLCLTLCDPVNRSMPGLPVHHQLLESTQTHVHCIGDTIQSSHPLSSPSPPALNLSQHQGLFK